MKKCVCVVGLGNIGSWLVDLLLRLSDVSHLIFIDSDSFTEDNLRTQGISRVDIGMPKARALARRAQRLRPDIDVVAYVCRIEDLPLGALTCDVLCSCLDSRSSRMTVNAAAFRLGVPWIDSGVLGLRELARVEVFVPGPDAPCYECGMTTEHYDTLDVRYACQATKPSFATNSPGYLGAFAASIQAAQVGQVLGSLSGVVAHRDSVVPIQIVAGLRDREHMVSRNRRNPACRFDHSILAPSWSGDLTVGELLAPTGATLTVPYTEFVKDTPCPACNKIDSRVRCLASGPMTIACRFCGLSYAVHPAWIRDRLSVDDITLAHLARTPRDLGLRPGDLFAVCEAGQARHYLLGSLGDLAQHSGHANWMHKPTRKEK